MDRSQHRNSEIGAKLPPCVLRFSSEEKRQRFEIFLWLFLFVINMCILALQIAGLSIHEWIKVGSGTARVTGGLLYCGDCPFDWSGSTYQSITDNICSKNTNQSESQYCGLFERIRDSGGVYFFIEIVSGVFLVVWEVKLFFQLLRHECLSHIAWLAYVHPILSTLLQIISLCIWSGMTRAKFSGDCGNFEGRDSDICVMAGPVLAIVTSVLLPVSATVYIVALRHWEALRLEKFPAREEPISLVYSCEERKE